MTNKFKTIIDTFKKSNVHDSIGLYEVIGSIQKSFKPSNDQELETLVFLLIKEMLGHGFLAVDLFNSGEHNLAWKDQNPEHVFTRIQQEWKLLRKTPNIGEICYFNIPNTIIKIQ